MIVLISLTRLQQSFCTFVPAEDEEKIGNQDVELVVRLGHETDDRRPELAAFIRPSRHVFSRGKELFTTIVGDSFSEAFFLFSLTWERR